MAVVRYWAVIPAAGVGARMQAKVPKQYLQLQGKTILEHTLGRFCDHPDLAGVVVAIAGGDQRWATLAVSAHPKIRVVEGGEARGDSVRNALRALLAIADHQDWVLIHDAARPCVSRQDIDRLIAAFNQHEVGGLLGLPVRDTMKRVGATSAVEETIDRRRLWRALTPQMFRLGMLLTALERAKANQIVVTDEAQAMELNGLHPMLIEGHESNIKVTHPDDLAVAELFLSEGDE